MNTIAAESTLREWGRIPDGRLWWQWVLANAGAEMIGLGTSTLLWIAMLTGLQAQWGILLSAILVVVGSTLLEGTAVGMGQWLVLRRVLPQLRWQSWMLATATGALIAWTLGMVPSTLMNMSESSGAVEPPVISDVVMYTLAALMGLVLGPVLAIPQWLVLRRHLDSAFWWIPANAVAWMAGIVVIFRGIGFVPTENMTWSVIPIVLSTLAVTGAVVGALHGVVLLWLLKPYGKN